MFIIKPVSWKFRPTFALIFVEKISVPRIFSTPRSQAVHQAYSRYSSIVLRHPSGSKSFRALQ